MADSNYWARFGSRRLPRRAFVGRGAAVGMGVAGMAVVGCSTSNNNNKATTAAVSASATRAATQAPVTTAVG